MIKKHCSLCFITPRVSFLIADEFTPIIIGEVMSAVNFLDPLEMRRLHQLNDDGGQNLGAIKKDDNLYACSMCNKEFQTKTGCMLHLDFHRGLTKCTICSHVSSRRSNLKQHMHFVHGFPMEKTQIKRIRSSKKLTK